MKKTKFKQIKKVSPQQQILMFSHSKSIFRNLGWNAAEAFASKGAALEFGVEDAKYTKPELVGDIEISDDKIVFTLNHNPFTAYDEDENCVGSCVEVSPSGYKSSDQIKYTIRKSFDGFRVSSKLLNDIYPLPVTGTAEFLQWEFNLPEEVYFAMLAFK